MFDEIVLSEFTKDAMYLPTIDLDDTRIHESKRSGFAELRVSIHEVPANGRAQESPSTIKQTVLVNRFEDSGVGFKSFRDGGNVPDVVRNVRNGIEDTGTEAL